jgi:hypothetical protein
MISKMLETAILALQATTGGDANSPGALTPDQQAIADKAINDAKGDVASVKGDLADANEREKLVRNPHY